MFFFYYYLLDFRIFSAFSRFKNRADALEKNQYKIKKVTARNFKI